MKSAGILGVDVIGGGHPNSLKKGKQYFIFNLLNCRQMSAYMFINTLSIKLLNPFRVINTTMS